MYIKYDMYVHNILYMYIKYIWRKYMYIKYYMYVHNILYMYIIYTYIISAVTLVFLQPWIMDILSEIVLQHFGSQKKNKLIVRSFHLVDAPSHDAGSRKSASDLSVTLLTLVGPTHRASSSLPSAGCEAREVFKRWRGSIVRSARIIIVMTRRRPSVSMVTSFSHWLCSYWTLHTSGCSASSWPTGTYPVSRGPSAPLCSLKHFKTNPSY